MACVELILPVFMGYVLVVDGNSTMSKD